MATQKDTKTTFRSPIISGIGTAPHNIVKSIAKISSPLLGTINFSHLKNSGNLLNKIRNMIIENKLVASPA